MVSEISSSEYAIDDTLSRLRNLAGGREQVALFPPYHHVVVPHARWRQPLPGPDVPNGPGAAQVWRPGTPAMAAGWTDPGWTLKDGLRFRVPPWPQPQTV